MEKNQNETGITLSFLRSDATHCTRKRIEKNACPRKPSDSQRCSVLIVVDPCSALVENIADDALKRWAIPSPHLTGHSRRAARTFPSARARFASPRVAASGRGARDVERVAHGLAERVQGLDARHPPSVDEEGRRARHAGG